MTMNENNLSSNQSDFILYTSNDGKVRVDVVLKDETVWLTQKAMAGLFGVKVPAISKHLANIYETGELEKESTISILEMVQQEEYRVKTRYRTSQEINFSIPHQQLTMRS